MDVRAVLYLGLVSYNRVDQSSLATCDIVDVYAL